MSELKSDTATSRSRGAAGIATGVVVLGLMVVGLYLRAASRTNHAALSVKPKPVSVVRAQAASFRPTSRYVGTLLPWGAAKVGPQYVSAYVGAVLVRPGAVVRRGDVLATLDCRGSFSDARETAARGRAVAQRQSAVAHESERLDSLSSGGFTSANEVEQLKARSAAEAAEVEGLKASLQKRNLQVSDCVLRSPFNGEVSERYLDPGAYVRPGSAVVEVIDRGTVRLVADAPESDFSVVAPGTIVTIAVLATGAKFQGRISRRAPAADEATRTVHFEVDIPNADRALPVGTTATLEIEVGKPLAASSFPLRAATLRGDSASVFVVVGGLAKRTVAKALGEAGGTLYVDPALAAGSLVVVEGRALLDDGDAVDAKETAMEWAK